MVGKAGINDPGHPTTKKVGMETQQVWGPFPITPRAPSHPGDRGLWTSRVRGVSLPGLKEGEDPLCPHPGASNPAKGKKVGGPQKMRGQEELSSRLPPLWLCGLGWLTAPLWACVLICEMGILNALASQTGSDMFTSIKLPVWVPGTNRVMPFPARLLGTSGWRAGIIKWVSPSPLGSWEGPWGRQRQDWKETAPLQGEKFSLLIPPPCIPPSTPAGSWRS